ncbi:MAG TPA: A/G-specific adenine glycosylase [Rariglobus sp.]|nr:A/G-specific adenine glycosylase [Rariglobus sp.]
MLQQTQVKTVLPYWERWMAALPTVHALARAGQGTVLKLWEGLGYYSRARNLHKLAKAVAAMPSPSDTPAGWQELPGIGPYTAAAITSISFGTQAAVVDGNVVRVLTRLTADATPFKDGTGAVKTLTPLANAVLNPENPGDHNQAMMELGATVCHRQNPLCTVCPVLAFCTAAKRGEPEAFPVLAPKLIEQKAVTRVWCLHNEKLLLHRTAAGAKRLANLHELPTAEHLGLESASFEKTTLVARKKRGITRFAITESIHRTPAPRGKLAEGLVWIAITEIDTLTLSGPHRRWVTELLAKAAR